MPLSIFETAGGIYRANSVDNHTPLISYVEGQEKEIFEEFTKKQTNNKNNNFHSEDFNKNIAHIHVKAIDHLKNLGYSAKVIEDCMRASEPNIQGGPD